MGMTEERREVHAAIRTLERARMSLEHASHDFGGHRTTALHAGPDRTPYVMLPVIPA